MRQQEGQSGAFFAGIVYASLGCWNFCVSSGGDFGGGRLPI
jgi:hypothetical protein